jgi:S1/P1 Nuclease
VTHSIGDLHQPLHCGDRDDKGGNSCLVFMPESRAQKATSLHSVWDGVMLRQWLQGTRVAAYADNLDAALTDDDRAAMKEGTIVTWANETHAIARDSVYPGVPAKQVTRLDQAYVDRAKLVTDKQLQRAGVRLATVLNKAFVRPAATQPVD